MFVRFQASGGHRALIDMMGAFGYKVANPLFETEGVCHGLANMTIQAILANDLITFEKRLGAIMQWAGKRVTNPEDFSACLSDIDLRAFFDGVALYNYPNEYRKLFSDQHSHKTQDFKTSMHLLMSVALEGELGIAELANFSGNYTLQELINYLACLREAIKLSPHHTALHLATTNHAIAISFDIENNCFIGFNTNPLSIVSISCDASDCDTMMAQWIMKAFCYKSELIIIATKVYCTSAHRDAIKPIIAQWLEHDQLLAVNAITQEKAYRLDEKQTSWLEIAVQHNQDKIAHALIKLMRTPNQILLRDNKSPLFLAIQMNYPDVVQALIEGGMSHAKPVQMHASLPPETPLELAVSFCCPEIIRYLLKKGLDPNQQSILCAAATKENPRIVQALLDFNANPNITRLHQSNQVTPLFLSIRYGSNEVIQTLLAHQADETYPCRVTERYLKDLIPRINMGEGRNENWVDDPVIKERMLALILDKKPALASTTKLFSPSIAFTVTPIELASVMGRDCMVKHYLTA